MFPLNVPEMTPDLHRRLVELVGRLSAELRGGKPDGSEWVLTIFSGDDCETVTDMTLEGAVGQLERLTANWRGEILPPPKPLHVWMGETGDDDTFLEGLFVCMPGRLHRQYGDQYRN